MKYIDEFSDKELVKKLTLRINQASAGRVLNIMEVCGTHTMSIFKFGLRRMLADNINFMSGPGCPVCVTPNVFLDKAIAIAQMDRVMVVTFGDMFRVPGSRSSLEKEKASGRDIRTVYSTLDALALARKNPDKEIVFLGVGFETTAPTVAQSILIARKERLGNYSVLCGHKTMPEVLSILAADKTFRVDGFLLPGHVSAIIGLKPYMVLAKKYAKRCVVSGFEPIDILESILLMIAQDSPNVDIEYNRIASRSGNRKAQNVIKEVFSKSDSDWRGIGIVDNSGLVISRRYSGYDAEKKFKPDIKPVKENKACQCGNVLKGVKAPPECALFARACTPENPIGACMVSSEGSCGAYYRYGR